MATTRERTVWYITHLGYAHCAQCAHARSRIDPDTGHSQGYPDTTPDHDGRCDSCGRAESVVLFDVPDQPGSRFYEFVRGARIF